VIPDSSIDDDGLAHPHDDLTMLGPARKLVIMIILESLQAGERLCV
jgi:hypothetical protein